jgi:hypothetical protein
MTKTQVFAAIGMTLMMTLVATNTMDIPKVTAATERSCDNWIDRHIKSHERMDEGKLSNGDIQSHDNGIKNRDNVCK